MVPIQELRQVQDYELGTMFLGWCHQDHAADQQQIVRDLRSLNHSELADALGALDTEDYQSFLNEEIHW